jgi:serine O-acetyltransferase
MFDNVRKDLRRYGTRPRLQLLAVAKHPAAWAVLGYRFRRWVQTAPLPAPVRGALKYPAALAEVAIKVATNIELPAGAEIGPGLLIAHSGYLVLSSEVKLGENCTLTHGVTLGHAEGGATLGRQGPVLGDRVYVGPGAAVIGPVQIGSDALVGVGSIVTRSVPDRGVVAGNPARVLSRQGSFKIIRYPGMDDDPARLASLAALGDERKVEEAS